MLCLFYFLVERIYTIINLYGICIKYDDDNNRFFLLVESDKYNNETFGDVDEGPPPGLR